MKQFIITLGVCCLLLHTVNAQLIKRDFLSDYSIDDNLEQGTYTSTNEGEVTLQNAWMYRNGSASANTKVITPLTYEGYVESGVDNAFEVAKLASGSGTLGYSITDTNEYNFGAFYLALMISINDNLGVNVTDRTRNMIGFSTKFTLDLSRVVLSVSKAGSTTGFKFGIGAKHSASKASFPMEWTSDEYNFNETYLAVLKYDFSTTKASLFINPAISLSEPSPLLEIEMTEADASGMVTRGIRAICLEQSNVDSRKIGGIRLAKSWESVLEADEEDPNSLISNYDQKKSIKDEFFTLTGIQITHINKDGIYLQRTEYDDGSVEVYKRFIKKH